MLYYDWIAHHADARGNKVAVIDLASSRSFTYSQWHERIDRLAAHLASLRIGKGDRVATLATNSSDMLEVQFACFRIGAIWVPLNIRLTIPELQFILSDASPSMIVHCPAMAEMAIALQPLCKITHRLAIGPEYEAALAASPRLAHYTEVTLDDVSTIMYTSGTTGGPKGATITHGMTFINAVNLGIPMGISQKAVFLCVLPLFHTGGLNCYTNPVAHAGGTTLIMRAFDPGETLKLINDAALGINFFFGVPSIYQFMGQHPAFAQTDFSRIITSGVGGAPMPVPLLQQWQARGLNLAQGFGMTETSPAVLALDADDAARKAGSAGKPLLHAQVKIVREDGTTAAPGELGELWVKGPNITPGYWNRPDANKTSFTDGWLHTGDASRVDEEGFYYIVDRTKDMYISGGENVYPAEVENIIYQMPQIAEAAIIGMSDTVWGETGHAIIAVKPGQTLTEVELIAHCRANLARFKCPQLVTFVEALPRNATGKVHKPTLREMYAQKAAAAE